MPLFSSEPTPLPHSARIAFEDCDESEWMFVATSRQVRSLGDKLQRKLHLFHSMTKYERRHVRISIRNGNVMTLQLFRSDSVHDRDCVAFYDLNTLQNAKNLMIEKDEALPFLTFVDDTSSAAGGIAVTEMIFGQIGLRLELEESVSDGVGSARHPYQSAEGSVSLGDALSSGAMAVASTLEAPIDAILGAESRRDLSSATEASLYAAAAGAKGHKRLQKKLERKGKALSLHLVLPNVTMRDEWGRWLRSLIKALELQRIADAEIDPITGDPMNPVDDELVQRMADVRNAQLSAISFRHSVKDYTSRFLNLAVRGDGAPGAVFEPPNKGRLQVRVPGTDYFSHYELSAWIQSGEIVLTPYHPKESFASQLLSQVPFAGGSTASAPSHGAKAHVRRLRLNDQTLICALVPWSCEFQIVMQQHEAQANPAISALTPSAVTQAATWYFTTASSDDRNGFVNWMRLVKGRGTVAQTERQTFPYKTAGSGLADDEEDASYQAYRDSHGGLTERLHTSDMIAKAVADAAAFVSRQQAGMISMMHSDAAESAAVSAPEADGASDPEPEEEPPAPVIHAPTDEEILLRLFSDLNEPLVSPRSPNDSIHSVRPFHYFPKHYETVVFSHVEETCKVHLTGRFETSNDIIAAQKKKAHEMRRKKVQQQNLWLFLGAASPKSDAEGVQTPRERSASRRSTESLASPHSPTMDADRRLFSTAALDDACRLFEEVARESPSASFARALRRPSFIGAQLANTSNKLLLQTSASPAAGQGKTSVDPHRCVAATERNDDVAQPIATTPPLHSNGSSSARRRSALSPASTRRTTSLRTHTSGVSSPADRKSLSTVLARQGAFSNAVFGGSAATRR